MKLSLVVVQGKPEGREFPVRLAQFLIGRDPECHLRPASPLVSKRHCAVLQRDNRVFLRDFDSMNGTLINGQPLKGEAELHDGDEFKVGPLTFRVRVAETAVSSPTPLPSTRSQAAAADAPKSIAEKTEAEEVAARAQADDDLAEMLLNLDGGSGAGSTPSLTGADDDPVPPGSTIMDVPAGLSDSEAPGTAKPDDKTKRPGRKIADAAATSNAAKAILDKYMRRPRT